MIWLRGRATSGTCSCGAARREHGGLRHVSRSPDIWQPGAVGAIVRTVNAYVFGVRPPPRAPFLLRLLKAHTTAPAQMRQRNERIAHVVADVALLPLRAFDEYRDSRLRPGVAERLEH